MPLPVKRFLGDHGVKAEERTEIMTREECEEVGMSARFEHQMHSSPCVGLGCQHGEAEEEDVKDGHGGEDEDQAFGFSDAGVSVYVTP